LRAELDHLVVACASLEQGCDWVERRLGARPSGGGAHPLMGTHNRLLRLGDAAYLEVIAPDPAAPDPPQPRWLGLDDPGLRRSLTEEGPRLVTWAVRTDDIAASVAACPVALGRPETGARGALRWLITLRPDGTLPEGGAMPALIQWPKGTEHVAADLPDQGLRLLSLSVFHPDPPLLRRALDAVGLASGADVTVAAGPVRLSAAVGTAAGNSAL
jgi:Glyoxalase-like domain